MASVRSRVPMPQAFLPYRAVARVSLFELSDLTITPSRHTIASAASCHTSRTTTATMPERYRIRIEERHRANSLLQQPARRNLSPSLSPSPSLNSSTRAIKSPPSSRTSRLPVRHSSTISRVPILRSGKASLVSIPPGRRAERSVTSSPDGTWGRSSDDEEEVTTPAEIGHPQGFDLHARLPAPRLEDSSTSDSASLESVRRSQRERTLQLLEGGPASPKLPGSVQNARMGIPTRAAGSLPRRAQEIKTRSSPPDISDRATKIRNRRSTGLDMTESAIPADIPRARIPTTTARKPATSRAKPAPARHHTRNPFTKLQSLLKSALPKPRSRIPTPSTPPPRPATTSPPTRQKSRIPPPRPARSPPRTPSPNLPTPQSTRAVPTTTAPAQRDTNMPAALGLISALTRAAHTHTIGPHRARILRFANVRLPTSSPISYLSSR
ncbi:uncharacterized protein MYCGRDRAFT_92489 [Zymoseptoria tritici IPO323]|uniref:Uncharacterized protein n=1 Tax=Zymoseptoria tritici (strain CBS 115943 / IPO323) TaxID=336722 RepID=F9X9G9_ZYMTI|nr:uncharacterized protein MYCGRDRAFT_92489 [Zymoseptoria tritici IPO323]EGP88436.1 hypothetical protein MYCGRDRAFT_92489 [Zymoseptoria tritici IPO323]